MNYTAKQLKQIAAVCSALTDLELDSNIYNNNADEATVINTRIDITTRNRGRHLGHVCMGPFSSYVFVPSERVPFGDINLEERLSGIKSV